MRTRIALIALLALAFAACGGGEGADDGGSPVLTDDGGSVPDIGGACLEDEPDCQDVGDPDAEPDDLPDSTGDPITPGDPLSVADVLAAGTVDGTFAVTGYLFVGADGAGLLCDAIAESYPPQCGGDRIPVAGELPIDQLSTDQDVSWSDQPIQLIGTWDGTRFTIG